MSTERTSWLARALRLACATALLAVAGAAAARVEGAAGTSFTLVAKADYITTADGGSVYMWGYALGSGSDCAAQAGAQMQYPGPTLIVEQGSTVTITLCNQLPANVSLVLPGQIRGASSGGVVGRIAREARPYLPPASATNPLLAQNTVSTTFVASRPGTYLYQSATQMNVQTEMGLVGALIVRPAGAAGQAYEHAGTRFDREHLLLLSEIDPVWHELVRQQAAAAPVPATGAAGSTARAAYNAFAFSVNTRDFAARDTKYFFINGRNGPDTMGPSFAAEMPAQPYNALARMHPGERLLMRMVNAGADLHPFHHHGNNSWTIAVDGRLLASAAAAGPDLARSDNTLQMIPGQTVDAIFEWTGKGLNWDAYGIGDQHTCNGVTLADAIANPGHPGLLANGGFDPATREYCPDHGKAFPTVIPSALEMTFGDLYSGSPFLGAKGDVPVGAGRLGSGGAYFHIWHSHNEREIINFGIFPGGMMTFVVIEPWNVAID